MADFATPQLIVTKAGINAANAANPFGPWVHITSFKIGSAYGYDPQKIPDDTDIDGDSLYHGVPTQYKNLGDGVIDIILRIPADAGPFQFGEIGIFNQDDTGAEFLFAKAVFAVPQVKYSSLGTNVASSFTIHALIKLDQSVAVFKIDTLTNQAIMEVDKWSDVLLPNLTADPDTPLLLVRELDSNGHSSLLHYSVPGIEKWTIGTSYVFVFSTTVKNSTALTVRVPAASVQDQFVSTQDTRYVIEIGNRNDPYRLCSSLVKQGQDAVFTLHPDPLSDLPSPGVVVNVYQSNSLNSIPLGTNATTGLVRAGDGVIINTPGVVETHGLLHSVQNAGRILAGTDNLMSTTLPSGVYDIIVEGSSRPANMPPGTYSAGQLYRTNTILTGSGTQSILDTFYPYNNQGTPSAPYTLADTYVWFKIYRNGSWSPWRQATTTVVPPSGNITYLGASTYMSGVFNTDSEAIYAYQVSVCEGGGYMGGYVAGALVMYQRDNLDNGRSQFSMTLVGRKGQSWAITSTGVQSAIPAYVYSRS